MDHPPTSLLTIFTTASILLVAVNEQAGRYCSRKEANMALQTRSIPRQIVYLLLALIGLVILLEFLGRYHW